MTDAFAQFIQKWWLLVFLIAAVLMYFFAWAGYRVQEDAKKRGLGQSAVTFWSVSVVFFGPIFLPLYLMFRSRAVFATGADSAHQEETRYKLCPHCGAENPVGEKICNECHKPLDSLTASLGEKACNYCGTMNPVDATRCVNCDQVIGYTDTGDEE